MRYDIILVYKFVVRKVAHFLPERIKRLGDIMAVFNAQNDDVYDSKHARPHGGILTDTKYE